MFLGCLPEAVFVGKRRADGEGGVRKFAIGKYLRFVKIFRTWDWLPGLEAVLPDLADRNGYAGGCKMAKIIRSHKSLILQQLTAE